MGITASSVCHHQTYSVLRSRACTRSWEQSEMNTKSLNGSPIHWAVSAIAFWIGWTMFTAEEEDEDSDSDEPAAS